MTARRAAARAARALLTLAAVFVLGFALLRGLPGDPSDRLDDPAIPAEQAARARHALGLDRPWGEQLARTAGAYLAGEWGVSFSLHRPVREALVEALPATLALGGAALLLAYGGGLALAAALLAARPGRARRADEWLLALATIPRFWLAIVLIVVLHDWAGWLPVSPAATAGGWAAALAHVVLPALTLALPGAARVARYQCAAAQAGLAGARVRQARAAGLRGWALWWRGVLRPDLTVVAALFGTDLPLLVSGAVVVETVFSWPGLGRLGANALLGADYPLALGCVMLTATMVVLGGLLSDGLVLALDPRAREQA